MGIVGQNDLMSEMPKHIAIIMDGNGRWANKRSLTRLKGHEQGAKSVRETIKGCLEMGIPYLTLFAFSSENWKRPEEEVNHLMGLFRYFFKRELKSLSDSGVSVRFIGDISRLPKDVQDLSQQILTETSGNSKLVLTIALSYGGRTEIINAAHKMATKIAAGALTAEDISEENFGNFLETAETPDPDMIIRTSGEKRLSNFLLWQAAYSELFFLDVLWPDFKRSDLENSVKEFQSRCRRYGAVSV
jgi:undecaprenyl diphosphate synthase